MDRERDLRATPPTRVQTVAFYEVKDLQPGEGVVLATAEDPRLLMESLNLQLRGALAWTSERAVNGWRTRVKLRTETAVAGLIDRLTRDHHRLDELLARALRRVNANDLAGAGTLVREFAAGIRAHVAVENEVLALSLLRPITPDGTDAVGVMLYEHSDILGQLAEVERLLAPGQTAEAWEVEPFIALLSGALAKHEYREESNLFPAWARALAAMPDAEREALERRGEMVLAISSQTAGR